MGNKNTDKVTITMTVREAETVRRALDEYQRNATKSYHNGGGIFARGEMVSAKSVTTDINMVLYDKALYDYGHGNRTPDNIIRGSE